MSGVSRKELELLLEFTYTGACQVEVADLKSFLKTGEELGYEGLLEAATRQEIPIFKNDLLKELDKEIRSPKESFSMGQLTKNLTLEVPPDSSEPHLVSTKVEKAADVENADIDVQPHTGELVTVEESVHSSQLDWTLEETFVGNQTTDDKNQATDDDEVEQESESTSTTELEDEHGDVKIENNLTCESCGYTALRSNALTRHQNEMGHFSSRLRFKCKLCPFRTNTTKGMHDHDYTVHSEKTYQCDQCPLKYKRKCELARHTERGHDTFKCKYCGQEAASEKMLKMHVITMQKYNEEAHTSKSSHIGKKDENGQSSSKLQFSCNLCPFKTNTTTKIRAHEITKHDKHGGLKFKCDQCDRSYNRKDYLVIHRKNVHDEFKCDYCGHKSRTEKLLKMHIRSMQKLNEEGHF